MIGNKSINLNILNTLTNTLEDNLNKLFPFFNCFNKSKSSNIFNVNVPTFITIDDSIYMYYISNIDISNNQSILESYLAFCNDSIISDKNIKNHRKTYKNSNLNKEYIFQNNILTQYDIIIRSSAIYSEDGCISGAGLYDSFVLLKKSNYDDFLQLIYKIYNSVNSKDAIEYRKSNNILNETMSLIIQEKKTDILYGLNAFNSSGMSYGGGHINTQHNGNKDIMKLSINSCSILIDKNIIKEIIDKNILYPNIDYFEDFSNISLGEIDRNQFKYYINSLLTSVDRYSHKHYVIFRIAVLAVLIENLIKSKNHINTIDTKNGIQIEFGFDTGFFYDIKNPQIYLYQVRTLNKIDNTIDLSNSINNYEYIKENNQNNNIIIVKKYGEKEKQLDISNFSYGFNTLSYNIIIGQYSIKNYINLNNEEIKNINENDIILIESAYGWSMRDNLEFIINNSAGILLIVNNREDGHIETRCIEKGKLFFNANNNYDIKNIFKEYINKNYLIVSDGKIAKFYN